MAPTWHRPRFAPSAGVAGPPTFDADQLRALLQRVAAHAADRDAGLTDPIGVGDRSLHG